MNDKAGQPYASLISFANARSTWKYANLTTDARAAMLVDNRSNEEKDIHSTMAVTATGVVGERRGGMLIHGAIIAREYGLPCVTGVPDATTMIQTGHRITVFGYLVIVIVGADTTL